jgi:putative oxidoreductase
MTHLIECLYKSLIGRTYICITRYATEYGFPLLLLFIRFWMARVFFYSGLTKISNWQSTIFLFKYEYKVPIIPTEIAAILATTSELILPIFLIIGLASRLATLPLLVMTAVIQFTYLDLIEHLYWAVLLGVILLHGPGKYSLDHWIKDKLK